MMTRYSRRVHGLCLITALAVLLVVAKAPAAQDVLRIGYFDLLPHVVQVDGALASEGQWS